MLGSFHHLAANIYINQQYINTIVNTVHTIYVVARTTSCAIVNTVASFSELTTKHLFQAQVKHQFEKFMDTSHAETIHQNRNNQRMINQ